VANLTRDDRPKITSHYLSAECRRLIRECLEAIRQETGPRWKFDHGNKKTNQGEVIERAVRLLHERLFFPAPSEGSR
jgi:hypothetical protein